MPFLEVPNSPRLSSRRTGAGQSLRTRRLQIACQVILIGCFIAIEIGFGGNVAVRVIAHLGSRGTATAWARLGHDLRHVLDGLQATASGGANSIDHRGAGAAVVRNRGFIYAAGVFRRNGATLGIVGIGCKALVVLVNNSRQRMNLGSIVSIGLLVEPLAKRPALAVAKGSDHGVS